jgi:hypothetical protein
MKKRMMGWRGSALFAMVFLFVLGMVGIFVTGEAFSQVRPAMVRSVDEPARVPYFVSAVPTCSYLNECYVTGSTVPAGKRVRVTRLEGILLSQTTSIFFALMENNTSTPVLMFPAQPMSGAFFGTLVSFNQEVDFYFEAGQTPFIVVGNTSSISTDSRNRLTIAGYIVDLLP